LVCLTQGFARLETSICGTYRDRPQEELHLHRYVTAVRKPLALGVPSAAAISGSSPSSRIPTGSSPAATISIWREKQSSFRSPRPRDIASQTSRRRLRHRRRNLGTPIATLDDDDYSAAALPFAFPFFGTTYQQILVHSDGNLTFVEPRRRIGASVAWTPHLRPTAHRRAVMDLNPLHKANGVRVLAEPAGSS